jgi:hypothetical protein
MRVAIMQPCFLPWAGYFHLAAKADQFVFLSDAQYQKNSWHNRNRILVSGAPHWITVPVKKDTLGQTIAETRLDQRSPWKKKLRHTIAQSYAKATYRDDLYMLLDMLDAAPDENLAALNMHLIKSICEQAGVAASFLVSTDMQIDAKRTDKLLIMLEKLDAKYYLSPLGAKDYLEVDDFTGRTEVVLEYSRFIDHPYEQLKVSSYHEKLSVVDVIAHIGFAKFGEYLKNEK